ncbi:tyrosine-protein kinase domain-containing protein [Bosea sp. (in: a-proteobacteria)]|uniref:tyrosine-protein kinase domain-containing protein n=1 Tax=Bosea sp. (in: a-proteobacteria) TaxID=1871050 RepID=UPI001AC58405|nr:tyrosine-protein kinase domain-containing protein [Bosea sp. (in: a-proteobacteria)]MBN9439284.1 P-loop NTPase [Bosea sp. (in: a-proteobacteria)]
MPETIYAMPAAPEQSAGEPIYDWKWMLRALLRSWRLMLLLPAIGALLAIGFVILRPSEYTASTVLNVTNLRLSASGQDTLFSESYFDPSFLDTQVQLVSSDPVILAVIDKRDLAGAMRGNAQRALKQFRSSLGVQQLRQSNLVQVSFTADNPAQAALVANAVAATYIAKLNTDREQAVQSASSWLRERMRGAGPQAHIVSAALPPLDKSNLRGILIIGGAAAVGAALAMMLALIFAFLDRSIREPDQAQAVAGVECLGIVPLLRPANTLGKADEAQASTEPPASAPAILSEAQTKPFSPLWQALRHVSVASDLSAPLAGPRSLAVTSALGGEGKTTIAANLALMAASSGRRILLVDAQLYDPALSAMLAPAATAGLAPFLDDPASGLMQHVRPDPASGLHFLPFGKAEDRAATAQILWSARMKPLFEQARDYDLIIFDMPPLVAAGDLRAATAHIHAILLVIEWGKASAETLRAALAIGGSFRDRLIGSVINKANPGIAERLLSTEIAIVAQQARLGALAGRRDAA